MRYKLRLNVDITECDDNGFPNSGTNRLQVTEEIGFTAASFMQIADVLGQFHELGEEIKRKTDGQLFANSR